MPSEPPEACPDRAARRNKVRKGTTSCWECKRRKIRCCFTAELPAICISCRHRGSDCITQDLPEPLDGNEAEDGGALPFDGRYTQICEKISKVEFLVESLMQQRARPGNNHRRSSSTRRPHNLTVYRQRRPTRPQPLMLIDPANDSPLSRLVSSYCPPIHVAITILRADSHASEMIQNLPDSPPPCNTPLAPSSTAPPIVLAQYLLRLATSLQELDSRLITPELCLDRPVRDIARRYFEAASRYVTSQNPLVVSIEGLETLMLEALYQVNLGRWRLAWRVSRRALTIAQLLGLHLPESQRAGGSAKRGNGSTVFLWRMLVYVDRFLCLMLCCPPAVIDKDLDEHSSDDHPRRMERAHAVVLGKLIARNENLQHQDNDAARGDQYEETKVIDYDLKRTARMFPATWWAPPSLTGTDVEVREAREQLLLQIHHYHLLLLLHLPYATRSLSGPSLPSTVPLKAVVPSYTYSKLSALTASREIMSRSLLYYKLRYASFSTHGIGFKVFIAAVAMLLAHIGDDDLNPESALEHQRLHDMRIVAEAIEAIEAIDERADNPLCSSCLHILRKLMEMEGYAAHGVPFHVWTTGETPGEADCTMTETAHGLELSLPHYGQVYITIQRHSAAECPMGVGVTTLDLNRVEFDPKQVPEWWPYSRRNLFQSLDGEFGTEHPPRMSEKLPRPSTPKDWPIEGPNSSTLFLA